MRAFLFCLLTASLALENLAAGRAAAKGLETAAVLQALREPFEVEVVCLGKAKETPPPSLEYSSSSSCSWECLGETW